MDWTYACPVCRAPLPVIDGSVHCGACGEKFDVIDGILRLLPKSRLEYLTPFLADYTRIRKAEGRGSQDSSYYRNLPDCPPDHPIAWQWSIRRNTYRTFRNTVLPRLGPDLKVLDLGAGVGWLSARLAEMGHHPCAVDLSVDDEDGLGAARHYKPTWPRVQAEFDHLPFPDASVDVVIYNASLHYSVDYDVTLAEALRVLRPVGAIIVLESPIYRKRESGEQMAAERHAAFEQKYGTASTALPSIEFLTWDTITDVGRRLGISWEIYQTWYGWKWELRPLISRVKGKREPSRFAILVACKPGQEGDYPASSR